MGRYSKSLTPALVLFACIGGPALAEQLPEFEDDPDLRQASRAFAASAYSEQVWRLSRERAIEALVRREPRLAPYYDTIEDFYRRIVPVEELQAHMAEQYARHFTAEELWHMEEFYASETGQKALLANPRLLGRSVEWALDQVRERNERLSQMLNEARASRSGETPE
jgi:hypothetical protein